MKLVNLWSKIQRFALIAVKLVAENMIQIFIKDIHMGKNSITNFVWCRGFELNQRKWLLDKRFSETLKSYLVRDFREMIAHVLF